VTAVATKYQGTFGGRAEEASRVRREIAEYLGNCPVTDDLVFIASELAANCILHARSRGASFRVRCELSPGSARIEAEEALTGPGGWGTQAAGDGNRIVWARLSWEAGA
jgi:anti-sigma regulatory factor (Ser/Thr protein kinase)